MNDDNELESLDGGLPHCCDNPADKLDSKMTEREQFEKEVPKGICSCASCNAKRERDYIKHLELKLATLREDITADAIMLIKEYALSPDEKLTGDAVKLKRKIIEAMGGDKLSKVRKEVRILVIEKMVSLMCPNCNETYCEKVLKKDLKRYENYKKLKDLKQILEGK